MQICFKMHILGGKMMVKTLTIAVSVSKSRKFLESKNIKLSKKYNFYIEF